MLFELFIFLTLIILGLVTIGVVTRHPSLIALAAVFCILTGAALMSEGLRDDATVTFERDGDVVTVQDFNTLTTANDVTVAMIAPLYFYGGFCVALLSLFSILWAVKQRKTGD